MADIRDIKERFEQVKEKVLKFVHNSRLPSTQGELIDYIEKCDKVETSIISMKSEVGIARAMFFKDYQDAYQREYKTVSDHRNLPKWEVDILIGMEPEITDINMTIQELDSISDTMNDFKWLVKARRDTAMESYKYLSGE